MITHDRRFADNVGAHRRLHLDETGLVELDCAAL
jgi:hypothetical protein